MAYTPKQPRGIDSKQRAPTWNRIHGTERNGTEQWSKRNHATAFDRDGQKLATMTLSLRSVLYHLTVRLVVVLRIVILLKSRNNGGTGIGGGAA